MGLNCLQCGRPCKKKFCSGPCSCRYRNARQQGEANPRWQGKDATYIANHMRVYAERGKATGCLFGCVSEFYEWANLTGNYADTADYAQMCHACNQNYDFARRTMGAKPKPLGKLSADDVRVIRARRATREPLQSIADDFGIAFQMVSQIARREAFAWVT